MSSLLITLMDALSGRAEREAWAAKVAICLTEGHEFAYATDIWLVCDRCGCRTPGSIDQATIDARSSVGD